MEREGGIRSVKKGRIRSRRWGRDGTERSGQDVTSRRGKKCFQHLRLLFGNYMVQNTALIVKKKKHTNKNVTYPHIYCIPR